MNSDVAYNFGNLQASIPSPKAKPNRDYVNIRAIILHSQFGLLL